MKAKWHGAPYHDYKEGKWLLTFETTEKPVIYDTTQAKELNISIEEYSKRRGLTANSYFWVLVNKIAKATDQDDIDIHDHLLVNNMFFVYADGIVEYKIDDRTPNKYGLIKDKGRDGFEYYFTRGEQVILAKPDGGFYRTLDGNPKRSNIFYHIKGTHQMNTKEMAQIIDDTVYEAKQLGIQTISPYEIERLKQQWGVNIAS